MEPTATLSISESPKTASSRPRSWPLVQDTEGEPQEGQHDRGTVDALEAVEGWEWDLRAWRWNEYWFARLLGFVEREGHCAVPNEHVEDDANLGAWVEKQRSFKRAGKLPRDREQLLSRLPDWTWDGRRHGSLPDVVPEWCTVGECTDGKPCGRPVYARGAMSGEFL